MGTWGPALYSDDLAADVRSDFRELIGDGCTVAAAVDRLLQDYASSLNDQDEAPVFWLALADTQWRLGRLEDRTQHQALRVIESGQDLARWDSPDMRRRRERVLAKLRAQLLSPPPAAKQVARPVKSTSDWSVGEVVAFRLRSGRLTLLRVIGHHEDRGGRSAVCELLDWTGESIPPSEEIARLSIRREASPRGISQFLFQQPKTNRDRDRIVRTGIVSTPAQTLGSFTVFVWPYVDRLLVETFALE